MVIGLGIGCCSQGIGGRVPVLALIQAMTREARPEAPNPWPTAPLHA